MEDSPLQNPAFKPPGLSDRLREIFLGERRPFDCVQIEITSHCFGKCVYCPHTTQKEAWQSRHMEAEVFARLWPLLRQAKRAHLQGWGEPFLHPLFFEFAAFARKAGCDVSTTSCGLKFDEARINKILGSGMDIIAFSLTGTDEKSNAARENLSFAEVCANIKQLSLAKKNKKIKTPEIHLAYLLLADRMEAARDLPALMRDLDVEMAVVSSLDYLAAADQKHLAIYPEETEKIEHARRILSEATQKAEKMGRIIFYSLPGKPALPPPGGCRENIGGSLYIDATGAVSPCVYLNVPGSDPLAKRKIFGNVTVSSPLEIWQNQDYREFRLGLMHNRPDAVCENCPKRTEIASL